MKTENKSINGNKKHITNKLSSNTISKSNNVAEKPVINKNKIIFDDDGNAIKAPILTTKQYLKKSKQKSFDSSISDEKSNEIGKKWYYQFDKYNSQEVKEIIELKDSEIQELRKHCKQCYDSELNHFQKNNPSDAKWLLTAIEKGTSKDRANAGALIVQSNPLANLLPLEKLIALSKISNKSSVEAVDVITELFINALLPPNRKLIPIQLRGLDWKHLKKLNDLEKSIRDKIFAYWHFEDDLKEQYFEFLKNMQAAIQSHQDANKNQAIVCASKLLCYAPEKEQMLLSMLVNKLGDPSSKVASKALHHLSDVAYTHPNMCEVITLETEKLLFRNNISEHAQHFALCFLGQIAPRGNRSVCTKLVQICFSYFKIIVQKGAVNSRIMQAILRCLKRVIADAETNNERLLTKDVEDTLYRLIHLADIQISLQTFSLLLQIMTVKSNQYDRFYNALYKKMFDINLINVGSKIASQFLHILHRAIHIDENVSRARAFIKRLLQISFYFPVQIACGCLIIVNKLLKTRPELWKLQLTINDNADRKEVIEQLNKLKNNEDDDVDDGAGDEHYKDVPDEEDDNSNTNIEKIVLEEPIGGGGGGGGDKAAITSSWHHAKNIQQNNKINYQVKKYDLYHRVPAHAGAEFMPFLELIKLTDHFHPTVQHFATTIIQNRYIQFYGDPLRDFSLIHFLERFSFKNPKKPEELKKLSSIQSIHNKSAYQSHGSRGVPVKNLTKLNCTEDERFIFEYLEQKRVRLEQYKTSSTSKKKDDDEQSIGSVDDDEFDAYLDGLSSAAAGDSKNNKHKKNDDIDFLKEFGTDLHDADDDDDDDDYGDMGDDGSGKNKNKKKMNKKKKDANDDDNEEIDLDFNDGDDVDDIENSDDDGSISLDGDDDDDDNDDNDDDNDDDDDGSISFDDDEDDPEIFDGSDEDSRDDEPPNKKLKKLPKPMSGKEFRNKLKYTDDMNSLFASADDFAEMLEETGKSKKHGTLGEIFNKDKSSDMQMKWEENRMKSELKNKYGKQRFSRKPQFGNKKKK